MRVVLQRVSSACVRVDGEVVGAIDGPGVVALVGVASGDGAPQVAWMARKVAELRMMAGEASLLDIGGSVLLVSQFTLYGDVRKGRRPSWSAAAPGQDAEGVVHALAQALVECGLRVAQGRFGAQMSVEIIADGPYTLVVDAPP
jgi:D-tyrosyl-tRNA(Tyr) deacylase